MEVEHSLEYQQLNKVWQILNNLKSFFVNQKLVRDCKCMKNRFMPAAYSMKGIRK